MRLSRSKQRELRCDQNTISRSKSVELPWLLCLENKLIFCVGIGTCVRWGIFPSYRTSKNFSCSPSLVALGFYNFLFFFFFFSGWNCRSFWRSLSAGRQVFLWSLGLGILVIPSVLLAYWVCLPQILIRRCPRPFSGESVVDRWNFAEVGFSWLQSFFPPSSYDTKRFVLCAGTKRFWLVCRWSALLRIRSPSG